MAIKLISVDISGDEELSGLLKTFNRLVTKKDKSLEERTLTATIQKDAEVLISKRLGARIISGKLGEKETADFKLDPSSTLVKLLYKSVRSKEQEFLSSRLEFKASTEGASTVGQLTLTTDRNQYFLPGRNNTISGSDIRKRLGLKGSGYLLDLDERTKDLGNGANITDIVFDDYFTKDSRLKYIFYSKASSMLLANVTNKQKKLIFLQFPMSAFNSKNFKATIEDKAIKIAINNSFQKAIINTVNTSHLEAINRVRPIKKTITYGKKTAEIDFLSRDMLDGLVSYGIEETNSIKSRPVDTFNVLVDFPKQMSKQQFISGLQLSYLVQKRLGSTMSKVGKPSPPDLKYRTGRFVDSVQIMPDYRRNMIRYMYNPLYSSLEKYGYNPDNQVKTATIATLQQLFTRKFNIVKG